MKLLLITDEEHYKIVSLLQDTFQYVSDKADRSDLSEKEYADFLKKLEEAKTLEQISIESDDSGHDYLIPDDRLEEFRQAVQRFESETDTREDEWINDYMAGGCLSQFLLFTIKKETQK